MPRNQITNNQRKALRVWYSSHAEKPKLDAAQEWWQSKFGTPISKGTCSKILSSRYDALDCDGILLLHAKRHRPGKWKLLEDLLCEWKMEMEANGERVDESQVIAQASVRWPTFLEYAGQPPPKFSSGWLRRLKSQFEIRKRQLQKVSSPCCKIPHLEISDIRRISIEYEARNIYNMDETLLYWKLSPLSCNSSKPGRRPDRSQISIALCVNSDGLDKCPPFYIGKGKQLPKALDGWSLEKNGFIWSQNPRGWMDEASMSEWLENFCTHVGNTRHILLLLDSCSGHLGAVAKFAAPPNIRIEFVPADFIQPLECGIIRNAKALYRKSFLEFTVDYLGKNLLPRKNIIHLALVWFTHAWLLMVKPRFVSECFVESKLLEAKESVTESMALSSEKPTDGFPVIDSISVAANVNFPEIEGFRQVFQATLRLGGSEDCKLSLEEYTEPIIERIMAKTLENGGDCDAESISTELLFDGFEEVAKEKDNGHDGIDTSLRFYQAQEQLQSLTAYMTCHEKCDPDTISRLKHLKDSLNSWNT